MNQLILENLNDLYNSRDGNIKNTYNIFLANSQNQIQVHSDFHTNEQNLILNIYCCSKELFITFNSYNSLSLLLKDNKINIYNIEYLYLDINFHTLHDKLNPDEINKILNNIQGNFKFNLIFNFNFDKKDENKIDLSKVNQFKINDELYTFSEHDFNKIFENYENIKDLELINFKFNTIEYLKNLFKFISNIKQLESLSLSDFFIELLEKDKLTLTNYIIVENNESVYLNIEGEEKKLEYLNKFKAINCSLVVLKTSGSKILNIEIDDKSILQSYNKISYYKREQTKETIYYDYNKDLDENEEKEEEESEENEEEKKEEEIKEEEKKEEEEKKKEEIETKNFYDSLENLVLIPKIRILHFSNFSDNKNEKQFNKKLTIESLNLRECSSKFVDNILNSYDKDFLEKLKFDNCKNSITIKDNLSNSQNFKLIIKDSFINCLIDDEKKFNIKELTLNIKCLQEYSLIYNKENEMNDLFNGINFIFKKGNIKFLKLKNSSFEFLINKSFDFEKLKNVETLEFNSIDFDRINLKQKKENSSNELKIENILEKIFETNENIKTVILKKIITNKNNKLFELKKKHNFKLFIDYKTFYYLTFYKYKLDSFQNLITKELYQQKYPNMNKEKFNDYKNSLLNDLQFIKDNNIDGIIINNELEKNEIVLSLNYLTKENDVNKILQFVKKNFQKRKISLKTKKEDEEILIDLIPILNYEQRRYFKYNNSNIEIKYKNHF